MASVRCVVFVILSCSVWAATDSGWQPIGPFGGDARSLAADPRNFSHLYAGTSNSQIYSSSDGGRHWSRLSEVAPRVDFVVARLIVSPEDSKVLYAGVYGTADGGGVFRSTDAGVTWKSMPGVAEEGVRALVMSPGDPRVLVAGSLTGVFRSMDGGGRWSRISPPNHDELHNVESLALDPEDPGTIYAGTWHLPWKTVDGGANWFSIKEGIIDDSDVFTIALDREHHETAYLGACSGIYRTDNGGKEWRKIQGMPASARRTRAMRQDPEHAQTVYAGTTEGLWKTEDGGKNWTQMTSPTLIVNDVAVDPHDSTHLLLATDRAGILESRDGGTSFVPANTGFSHRQVWSLYSWNDAQGTTIAAAVRHDKEYGGVFLSRDGKQWQSLPKGLDGNDPLVLTHTSRGDLVAGASNGLYRLNTREKKWEHIGRVLTLIKLPSGRDGYRGTPLETQVQDLAKVPSGLLAATPEGVLLSDDNGTTWFGLSPPWPADRIAATSTMYVAATSEGVQLSFNRGRTWKLSKFPETPAPVHSLVVWNATIYAATDRGLFRSTDAGQTWEKHGRGVPFGPAYDVLIDPADPRRIYVASAASDRIYVSRDGGQSYEPLDAESEFVGRLPRRLTIGPGGRLYLASGYDGLFSRTP